MPTGLILTTDMVFAAKVRGGLSGGLDTGALMHRCETLAQAEDELRLRRYAFALVDARGRPMQAADLLAAILAVAPRLPVIVCLSPGEVRPPEAQLRALGAFEIVTSGDWPNPHLTAALSHATWFATVAAAANDSEPATGLAEPDRPLLAEVSHEMRSPLNSIIGFAESIEQQALGPWPSQEDRYRDYARHIRNSGEHLLALFNDLLQIGDSSVFELELTDCVPPGVLAENVAAMMRPAAWQKGVSLTCIPADGLSPVHCNARFLSQALLNLLQNAVKFTEAGGTVCVTVDQDGDSQDGKTPKGETRFTVRDNGIGFSADRLRRPRNSAHGRHEASGHGLGLRFVERVIATHRGRLDIDSRLGQGTEICIALPPNLAAPETAD